MRRLKKIAGNLVRLPKDDPAGNVNAGPPFELPYTLNLPDHEPGRTDPLFAHLPVVDPRGPHFQCADTTRDALIEANPRFRRGVSLARGQ
jgi:hypothetical protein